MRAFLHIGLALAVTAPLIRSANADLLVFNEKVNDGFYETDFEFLPDGFYKSISISIDVDHAFRGIAGPPEDYIDEIDDDTLYDFEFETQITGGSCGRFADAECYDWVEDVYWAGSLFRGESESFDEIVSVGVEFYFKNVSIGRGVQPSAKFISSVAWPDKESLVDVSYNDMITVYIEADLPEAPPFALFGAGAAAVALARPRKSKG